ncbi:hypothetical protein WA577_002099, partial [Blastocystis sp. JDR]
MSAPNANPFLRKTQAEPSQPSYPQQGYGQQPSYPQQQPFNPGYQQPSSAAGSFSMPSIPSLNTGNAVFDMAFNQTTNMMKNQLNAYKPEATGMWNNFKKYFKVSNRYVVAKLRLLLLPFGSKSWKRISQVNDDGSHTFLPPREDVNAPDLYIPLMAIFTYIVTVGFTAGTKGQFSPSIISSSLSACSVAITLEWILLKVLLYLISCPVGSLDLLAIISYKFVGLCIYGIVSVLASRSIAIAVLLYVGVCMVVFTLHSMNATVNAGKDEERKKRKLRNYFVFSSSVAQIVWMYLLSRYMRY